jgi:8-oxo-dGTP pyrophosphatase MutT (NUDIX family)
MWITLDGQLESGESYEQAALRELWEETGVEPGELGPWVWNRN